ncbi:hypothetical protein NMG60_11033294, partial [Bertholletia excelsa]
SSAPILNLHVAVKTVGKYFIHQHEMELYDKEDARATDCNHYHCRDCYLFYIHNSSSQILESIQNHPFHPLHTLYISYAGVCSACRFYTSRFVYSCSSCSFNLHFSHSHPLIFFSNQQNFPIRCYCCRVPLGYSVCFCANCNVLLHETCANLPREIKHVLHPSHNLTLRNRPFDDSFSCVACNYHSSTFAFQCLVCDWILDIKCALSKPTIFVSDLHHHPLAFFNKNNDLFLCDMCHDFSLTSVFCPSPFVCCVACNFSLYVHCISTLPNIIKYRNHVHPLTLNRSPIKDFSDEEDDAEFYCDACKERRLFACPTCFCEKCHYVAYPHCVFNEEKRQTFRLRDLPAIQSVPLIFFSNQQNFPIRCYCCRLLLGNFICFYANCNVLLHETCADLPCEIKHVLHHSHNLTLIDRPLDDSFSCVACNYYSSTFTFRCLECDWIFDIKCVLSKPTIFVFNLHRHPHAFFNNNNDLFLCDTPFVHCVACNFSLHGHCISTLPNIIEYGNDMHPLTLNHSPIKDFSNQEDDAKFYCDACEKERLLAYPTYFYENATMLLTVCST